MFVAYYRVSTLQQGESGLGLDAQKDVVMRFVGNTPILGEFTEVESGKRHKNRPQLQAALDLCKKRKAKLVIAKLDRLSRNVAFISSLMEAGVDFVCCDNPHANRLMLHMLAAFAEHEREVISQRTKAALGRVKAQLKYGARVSLSGRVYTKLGGPKLAEAREKAAALKRAKQPAATTVDIMAQLRARNETFRAIAAYVNSADIRSAQGCAWHASTVRRALMRAGYTELLNDSENEAIPSVFDPSAGRGPKTEGGMDMPHDIKEAERMLDLFTSVGAQSFVVTKLDIDQKLIWAKPYIVAELRQKLPAMVRTAATRRAHTLADGRSVMAGENLIVRPRGEVTFVQLDDLSAEQLERVRPAAFLIHSTSSGNHQAWIAVQGVQEHNKNAGHAGATDKDFIRRVRAAVGDADRSASGATRLSGTENWKIKNLPEPPVVTIIHAVPGRIMTPERVSETGLLAEPEPINMKPAPARVSRGIYERPWPSYEITLSRTRPKKDGSGPDRSVADYSWCLTSLTGSKPIEDTIVKLLEVSENARERAARGDEGYARITVENAAAAVAKNWGRNRA